MTPYQKFLLIFEKWFHFTSVSIGHDIFDKNFRIRAHTIATVVFITSQILFCSYTMLAFDIETALKTTTVLSLALQVRKYGYDFSIRIEFA